MIYDNMKKHFKDSIYKNLYEQFLNFTITIENIFKRNSDIINEQIFKDIQT